MASSPQIISRLRILLSAKLIGCESPVCLRSYLKFIHYKTPPLPKFTDSAPCEIRFNFDTDSSCRCGVKSFSRRIYKGSLLLSKGAINKPPGFYLPSEAYEAVMPEITGICLELESGGLDMSDPRKSVRKAFALRNHAFSIPVGNSMFIHGTPKTLAVGRIVFEHWMA